MDDITNSPSLMGLGLLRPISPPLPHNQHDPVAAFFDYHPSPHQIEAATGFDSFMDIKERFGTAMAAFITVYNRGFQESDDPDFDFMVDAFVKQLPELQGGGCHASFQPQTALAIMALKRSGEKNVVPAVTRKEKLLEYYAWVICGRVEETSPLRLPRPDGIATSSSASFHSFLPSSSLGCGPCENCGAPDAQTRCSGCQIVQASKVVFGIYYCNKDCRDSHWDKHKSQCKEVRALRRASDIFTEFFHHFLREAWNSNFSAVTVGQDGITTLVVDLAYRRPYLGLPLFRPFPRQLVDSEDQALAMLCNSKCRDVLDEGRPLFDHFMRPVCLFAEEIVIHPKNITAPYRTVSPGRTQIFGSLWTHNIVRITLPCGLQFALDATGAQYGWREVLSPWPAYKAHRVRVIGETHKLELRDEAEFNKYARAFFAQLPRSDHWHSQSPYIRKELINFLTRMLLISSDARGDNLETILHKFPDAKFEEIKKEMINLVKELLDTELMMSVASPCKKLYWNQDMETCVTSDGDMYKRLTKVWFTEEEYDELTEDKREALWKRRFRIATQGMPARC